MTHIYSTFTFTSTDTLPKETSTELPLSMIRVLIGTSVTGVVPPSMPTTVPSVPK